jgi:hypothetical protein
VSDLGVDGSGARPRTGATILKEGMSRDLCSVLDDYHVDKMLRHIGSVCIEAMNVCGI